jgi:hypothetical protein
MFSRSYSYEDFSLRAQVQDPPNFQAVYSIKMNLSRILEVHYFTAFRVEIFHNLDLIFDKIKQQD